MKYLRIVSIAAGVFILTTAVMISTAEARTKKYKPLKFTEVTSAQISMKMPAVIGTSDLSPAFVGFTAPVRLPPGTEVTGLDLWCSLGPGGRASVGLAYYDPSELTPVLHQVYVASTTVETTDIFTPKKVEGELLPMADKVIRKGRLYFLQAGFDPQGFLWRADLSYRK
jgi:hypothetical protein